MKNLTLTITAVLIAANLAFSQGTAINDNGSAADNSAILDVSSTSKGQLMPRMTTAERNAIASPAQSLLIYNTTTRCFEFYDNSAWQTLGCTSCPIPTGVSASASPNPVCSGYTLSLTGNATDATSWSWTGPNGFSSSLQNPTVPNITAAGAGVYSLTASNSCGSATPVNTSSVSVNCSKVNFPYVKAISVSNVNSDTLKIYQVLVSVTWNSHINSDFSDLRFSDSNCDSLNYFIESYVSSTSAQVYVNIPSIPPGGKTIYMHYGNAGALSTSNEAATFYIKNRKFDYTPAGANWTSATAGTGACNAASSSEYHSSPNCAYVYETSRACKRAHLQQTITLPDVSPLYLHYWQKYWCNYWGQFEAIKLGATNTDWANGTVVHYWWGTGYGGGGSSDWNEVWDDISAFKGQTLMLEIVDHDDTDQDPTYCSFGDHGGWLKVDDLSITTTNTNPVAPSVSIGSEVYCN